MGSRPEDREGDLHDADCPTRQILDRVMTRWGSLTLVVLRERTYRFSELRDRVGGVSEKMLVQTLRMLEEDGFVDRHSYGEVPPRVEYTLTPMGRELADRVAALGDWIVANFTRVLAEREHRSRARTKRRQATA